MRRGWLIVLAKAPQPGRVKTRMCPPLTAEQAAELSRSLLADALEESVRAGAALGLETVLAVEPPRERPELAVRAPPDVRVIAQCGPDLAARMTHAVRQASAAGARCALLRGSDSPALDREVLRVAAAALAFADVVLCPDRDGGYNLVALGPRALARPGVFDHPMSTPTVLRDTVASAARLGLCAHTLPPGFDLDRFEDLRWLARARAGARERGTSLPCRRTLAFLDERGLWPPEGGSAGLPAGG